MYLLLNGTAWQTYYLLALGKDARLASLVRKKKWPREGGDIKGRE